MQLDRAEELVPRAAKLALLACTVGMMSSLNALFLGTMPLFLEPVSTAMGWGRATFPALVMAVGLIGALLGPLIGRCIDRIGARPIALAGIALWGLGLILLSRLGPSLMFRAVVILLLGLGGGLAGHLVYAHGISRWFERHRGMALAIALGAAPALAQAIAAPVVSALIHGKDWRFAYLSLGVFVITVTLGTVLLYLREPEHAGPGMPGSAATLPGESAGAAMASARFWLITLAIAIATSVYSSMFQHSVAMLTDKGVSQGITTAFVVVTALAAVPSPLLAGALLDGISAPKLAATPLIACPLLGALLLANFVHPVAVLAAAVCFGLALGAGPALLPFVLARYFGPRSQSEIFGLALIILIASTAGGPVLLGVTYDRTGSYASGVRVFELLGALALAIALFLPRYRYSGTGKSLEGAVLMSEAIR